MTRLTFSWLGTPQVLCNGRSVETDRRKAIALLSYLSVTAVRHSREALATLLWPEAAQAQSLAYLRRTIWEINNMLGEGWLEVERSTVGLRPGADIWLDVGEFTRQTADFADLEALSAAAELYRGDFLAGFTLRDAPSFDEWQYFEAERLRQLLAATLERLAGALAQRQEWETAVAHARRWLTLDPLHEAAHRQLMQLYAQMGQKSAALRQYESCATILEKELGVLPAPETQALYQRIRRGEIAASQPANSAAHKLAEAPPTPQRHPPASQLPTLTTPFIGRQAELAALEALLHSPSTRLVTLLGPGGSGKTRLALEVARQQQPIFGDGVFFVPLAALNAPEEMVTAVAKAVHLAFFQEGEQPRRRLFDYLQDKELLLLLDNYEHLLACDGAEIVTELLQAAPRLKLLVTSRVRLGLQAEQLYAVAGLTVPDLTAVTRWQTAVADDLLRDYSALHLFVTSARRAQPDFLLRAENVLPVARICQLVAGMPLALELAAAWVALLSAAEIEQEIRRSLDFLETGSADLPDRQRSMRAVFNYSWQLLTPEEQTTLPLLTIFQGGFSREAAQRVAGASLRVLLALAQKSLVARLANGRFALHELVCQYAAEHLQAEPERWLAARDRHSAFYLRFLQTEGWRMQGPQQRAAFDAVEQEIENVRAAWLWAMVQQHYTAVLPTVNPLIYFYMVRSTLSPGLSDLCEMVLDDLAALPPPASTPSTSHLLYLQLLAIQAWALSYDYTSPRLVTLCQRALHLADAWQLAPRMGLALTLAAAVYASRVDRADGLNWMHRSLDFLRQQSDRWALALAIDIYGSNLHSAGQRQGVKELLGEGVDLSRQLGDDLLLAYNLTTLAWVLTNERNFAQAEQIYLECQPLFERVGDRAGAAFNFLNLGSVYDVAGDYALAAEIYQRGRLLLQELGRRMEVAGALGWESQMWQRLGEYETAVQLRQQALAYFQQAADENGVAWSYFELAELHRLMHNQAEATRFYAQSFVHFTRLGMAHGLTSYYRAQGQIKLAQGNLTGAQTDLEQSLALAREDSLDYWNRAYTLSNLGELALCQGNLAEAEQWLHEALRLAEGWGSLGISLVVLLGFGRLELAQGRRERAVERAALILAQRATWAEVRPLAAQLLAEAKAGMATAAFAAAEAKGRELPVTAVVAELLAVIRNP